MSSYYKDLTKYKYRHVITIENALDNPDKDVQCVVKKWKEQISPVPLEFLIEELKIKESSPYRASNALITKKFLEQTKEKYLESQKKKKKEKWKDGFSIFVKIIGIGAGIAALLPILLWIFGKGSS